MANVNRSPTTGSLGFNGRGATGGVVNSGDSHSKSGWGVGLVLSGQSLSIYDTTQNKAITVGAPDALLFGGDAPTAGIDHIRVTGTGSLQATGYAPTLAYSWTTFPTTGSLAFTGYEPTVLRGTNRTPTTGSLTFTGVEPTLAYSWTVKPTTGSLAFTGIAPDRIYGINRTPTTGSLTFASDALTLAYSWTVKPTAGSLALSGKTPASIYGIVRNPTTGSLTTTGEQVYLGNLVTPGTGSLTITGYQASVLKITPDTGSIAFTGIAPARINVANAGRSITNPSATTSVPSNYEQCDYTGFRQLPGSLKLTWNKHAVRKKSWESRHPQDVLRSVPERQKGSKRPEQADTFIDTAVSKDDL